MGSLGSLLYLSRADIEKLNISVEGVIKVVEEAFREKAKGNVETPPKPGVHPQKDAFIHAMPAYLSKIETAGVKWVSGFPENPQRGLPYVSGLLILNDVETGLPICVMDCTWITAKRTGAATAVAAKYLAREDSKAFGVLGCGVQGRSNLEALLAVFKNLEEVKAYDVDVENQRRYVEEMTAKHEVKVVSVNSPRKAVENCDLVVTAGPILKNPQPCIEALWFKDGGFACALDFDSYWKPEAIRSMDKFCTDDVEQLKYYKQQGYFRHMPEVYAELNEIVSGKKHGRENSGERIMSMNLGLAIEDMATAKLVYEKAKEKRIGASLPL
ncbi:MAG: ornithine cyclodeaminase family protein [Candidatus Bathyarchaeota archaeon]|nr:ornithine cyclodeaminase family protein [Candidatus Bathyarchaeota archaeon]MDH5786995.1 ornithine cyclodeaminase family protein [Candidatus Bathyarchaeota archaeon]